MDSSVNPERGGDGADGAERDPEDAPHEIHVFEDGGGWMVVTTDGAQRFEHRAAAFGEARDAARRHAPSVLRSSPPEDWDHPPAPSPSAPPRRPSAPATRRTWEQWAGPPALGRSLLVSSGTVIPEPWREAERITIDQSLLASSELLTRVRRAYLSRTAMVFTVADDLAAPEPGREINPVWGIDLDHDFIAEATWDLITRNAVDARSAAPSWPAAGLAADLGATPGGDGDVTFVDGRAAWCDGGPLRLWSGAAIAELGALVVSREALELGLDSTVEARQPLANLAADQLEAVADPDMRARIIAPAGSGKTRVLTERARHLLRSGVPARAVLLVAFNKRAQEEMVERTRDLPALQVQTLNALGLSVLSGRGGPTEGTGAVRTIQENEVRDLIGEMVQFPRRANTDPAASWIDALSAVRLGLRSPKDVEAEFDGDVDGFAEFFPRYREELRRGGLVDFDEQIYRAVEVLLADPALRRRAQRHAQILLVDEFQDLKPAHMLMLRLLAGPALGIFGVGDDDQTIYGYSGASPRWLVSFDQYVPMAAHHELTVNYRCPTVVVRAARHLLSRNEYRVPKQIAAGPDNVSTEGALEIVKSPIPVVATCDLICAQIAAGAKPGEIAVLTRVNTLLAPVQAALRGAGLPVHNRDGTRFLARTGVAAALAWLRLAVSTGRLTGADVMRAAHRPTRGLSARGIEWMGEQRDLAGLERLAERITDERSATKVSAFAEDLARLRTLAEDATAAVILESIRTETGLDRSMQVLDGAHRGRNSAAHSDDLRALVALGHLHPDAVSFDAWVSEILRPVDSSEGITLATVHTVKGLEWPHVIVYDATSGIFPHRLSTDIEEERRVFHVAITRARRSVHIVADTENPSMFLDELATEGRPAERAGGPSFPPGHVVGRAGRGDPDRSVAAKVGLVVSWGGYECTISTITDAGAVVSVGQATMAIPFGSQVKIGGHTATLSPAAKSSPRAPFEASGDPGVVEALKAWRLTRSRRDRVPAYVVFPDATLDAIAVAMPATESELLAIAGMGPKRVEAYGDEVIATLDQVRG